MIIKVNYNLSQYQFVLVEGCTRLTKKAKLGIKEKMICQLKNADLGTICKIRNSTITRADKEGEKYLDDNNISEDYLEHIRL